MSFSAINPDCKCCFGQCDVCDAVLPGSITATFPVMPANACVGEFAGITMTLLRQSATPCVYRAELDHLTSRVGNAFPPCQVSAKIIGIVDFNASTSLITLRLLIQGPFGGGQFPQDTYAWTVPVSGQVNCLALSLTGGLSAPSLAYQANGTTATIEA